MLIEVNLRRVERLAGRNDVLRTRNGPPARIQKDIADLEVLEVRAGAGEVFKRLRNRRPDGPGMGRVTVDWLGATRPRRPTYCQRVCQYD